MDQMKKPALRALIAAALFLLPHAAFAQSGQISGIARDVSGAALPGVTVEVSGPQLIERVRSAQTDSNGRYQITSLPVGTYKVTFTLQGFSVISRDNVQVATDFTANVNADLKVGDIKETVDVTAEAPTVDVANARQQQTFRGEELRDLPTSRNVPSLMALVPGIASSGFNGNICNGGVGVFCSPIITNFNSHTSANDTDGLAQGRLLVNGMPINSADTSLITGQSSGYNADIANAQEVSFTLSGSLGESETGGVAINIVPRTGGNRYAGNYFTSYTEPALLRSQQPDANRRAAESPAQRPRRQRLVRRPDQLAIGCGSTRCARRQGKESSQTGGAFLRQPERREVRRELRAGHRSWSADLQESVAQHQHAPHVPGHAEEQVQRLLGRAGHLQNPCDGIVTVVHVA